MNPTDTIILGAGAAGLAAAVILAEAGKTFRILEARYRVGGRVHTVRDALWPLPLDLGAEFIHGRPTESCDLVREAGLRAYGVNNEHRGTQNGKRKIGGEAWSELAHPIQPRRSTKSGDQGISRVCLTGQ